MTNGTGVKDRRVVPDYAADIKEILGIVTEIKVQNATRDSDIEFLKGRAQYNYECLEGNGKPGLKSDMERVLSFQKNINWGLGIIGGAVLVDIVTRILALP